MSIANSPILKPSLGAAFGSGYLAHPRYRGCVGHWLMAEAGRTVVRDISPSRSDGAFAAAGAAPTWTKGRFGPALHFTAASNQYMEVTRENPYDFAGNFSISLWARTSVTAVHIPVCKGGTSTYQWEMRTSNANFQWYVYQSAGAVYLGALGAITVNNGQWHHAVGVVRGTTCFLYTDGREDANDITPSGTRNTTGTSAVRFGLRSDAAGPYEGDVDDVRLYNRALRPEEITSLYRYPFLEFAYATPIYNIAVTAPAAAAAKMPQPYLQAVNRAGYY